MSPAATTSGWRCLATKRAAAAFDAQARTADRPHGPGCSGAPLVRRPTGTDHSHHNQGGGARGPSRSSSSCTRRSPAGCGLPVWVSRQGHRNRFSGTPWTPHRHFLCPCRCSMFLCGRPVDQPADVLKNIDMSTTVEQVLDVPKNISQDSIPQRAALRVPQLAEQLVDVPLPSSFECSFGEATVLARYWDTDGLRMVPVLWSRPGRGASGGSRGHDTPSNFAGGTHRQPRAVYKYWAPCQFHRSRTRSWTRVAVVGRPCDHAAQVPAVLRVNHRGTVPVVVQRI